MIFLKPDKYKFNIFVLLFGAVYLSISLCNIFDIRRDVAVEVYTYTLGGEIEKNSKELNKLYSLVASDARSLPQENQNVIRNILLKYNSAKWGFISIVLYILSCLILHRIDTDKYGGNNT